MIVRESLIIPAINVAALNKKNSTFREFTNKIFDILSDEKGVSSAAGIIEWLEDELYDLFNLGKNAEEALEIIKSSKLPF